MTFRAQYIDLCTAILIYRHKDQSYAPVLETREKHFSHMVNTLKETQNYSTTNLENKILPW